MTDFVIDKEYENVDRTTKIKCIALTSDNTEAICQVTSYPTSKTSTLEFGKILMIPNKADWVLWSTIRNKVVIKKFFAIIRAKNEGKPFLSAAPFSSEEDLRKWYKSPYFDHLELVDVTELYWEEK